MTDSLDIPRTRLGTRTATPALDVTTIAEAVVEELNTVLTGKSEVIRRALCVILAGGHLLLEDVPGVGKTALASALAHSLGCDVTRIQFTADLLPADLTGASMPDQATGQFVFRPGPLFTNVVIADEINRASPRTQSALIECMAEGSISVDGTTYPLPDPFLVIATQNPEDMAGTYPLPEAQRDRFMARLTIGYPAFEDEQHMIRDERHDEPVSAVISRDEVLAIRDRIADMPLSEDAATYLVEIVRATRADPQVRLGASPRAALQLAALSRSWAAMAGRNAVIPDDIAAVAVSGLAHRLVLDNADAPVDAAAEIIARIVAATPVQQRPQRAMSRRAASQQSVSPQSGQQASRLRAAARSQH